MNGDEGRVGELRVFAKSDQYVSRTIASETIIVPVCDGVAHMESVCVLNEVGAAIWQLLDGRTSVRQLVESIVENFDVSDDVAKHDIIELLDSMQKEGLIHEVAEASR